MGPPHRCPAGWYGSLCVNATFKFYHSAPYLSGGEGRVLECSNRSMREVLSNSSMREVLECSNTSLREVLENLF